MVTKTRASKAAMKPMKFILFIACLLFVLIGLSSGQQEDPQAEGAPSLRRRPRRRDQGANNNNAGASVSGSMALAGPSLGAATRPSVEGAADLQLRPAGGSQAATLPAAAPSMANNNKANRPSADEYEPLEDGAEDSTTQQPSRRLAKKRRPLNRSSARTPPMVVMVEESRYQDEEDELCEDDDYQRSDYSNLFESMAGGPMRQFGRLMKSAFGQGMPMSNDGGNMASASAFSSPGLSRVSSSVSNNGQTRGIMTETRNGRTQTRTFGELEAADIVDADDY